MQAEAKDAPRPAESAAGSSAGTAWGRLVEGAVSLLWQAAPPSVKKRVLARRLRQGRPTVTGLMQNLEANGFMPTALVDVGAFVGDWSRKAVSAFPSVPAFMLDANPENAPALEKALRELTPGSRYIPALLGPEEREDVTFFQRADCSTVLPELTSFETHTAKLRMVTLDGALRDQPLQRPILLKLDVQGFELAVLRGGRQTLDCAEVVILEVSLLPYNQGAPLFAEVVAFMAEAGFVVYDFCGQFRRQTDRALFQTDVVFVGQSSQLRAPRKFYLDEP